MRLSPDEIAQVKGEKMTVTKLLWTYFRLEGETLTQFAAELKKLSPDEKIELAAGVAAILGVGVTN
jgi:hypothetical protein